MKLDTGIQRLSKHGSCSQGVQNYVGEIKIMFKLLLYNVMILYSSCCRILFLYCGDMAE